MKSFRAIAFTLPFILTGPVFAEDLHGLIKEYEAAKAQLHGASRGWRERADRGGRSERTLAPIVKRIAAVGSKESMAFLLGEMTSAPPEIGAVSVEPLIESSIPGVLKLALQGFPERNRIIQSAILGALEKTQKDLAPVETEALLIVNGTKDADVRNGIPLAVGKVHTLPVAKALFSHVHRAKVQKGADHSETYNTRVVLALKETKSPEVKEWLGEGAFKAAGSDHAKLAVAAKLAGHLSLEAARDDLEKLVGHPSIEVSTAAVESIARVGIGSSSQNVAAALERRKGNADLAFRIQALDALSRSGTAEALEVVLRFARGSDAEMRIVSMGSLADFKDNAKAEEALARGLEDTHPDVRSAALRAASKLRAKSLVGPLVARLAKEKDERLKVAALENLVRLTNQNMGLVHEDWNKWWEVNSDGFELPKPDEKSVTSVKVHDLAYFGIEVASNRLSFLIDISSSMTQTVPVRARAEGEDTKEDAPGTTTTKKGGEGGRRRGEGGRGREGQAPKIEILKRELVRLIKKLPAATQINILTFDGAFAAWQKELQPLAGQGRTRAVRFVEGLATGSGTNVFDTLEEGLKDRRADTIYLLTDGVPSAGRLTEPGAILREIQKQNRLRGVTIHCIAFGEESQLLKDLAAQNGGKYRFVDSY
ncbi:MAG TPA: HEAT repeat domain-containing protein [Planctomycetota bacterium]|nr:HEAT repeat domain-containing protein [Planctomycetota bacterium]